MPLYHSCQDEVIRPQHNPLDQGPLPMEALDSAVNESMCDSIRMIALIRAQVHALSFFNMGVDTQSKTPMSYDPANIAPGCLMSRDRRSSPEIVYDHNRMR